MNKLDYLKIIFVITLTIFLLVITTYFYVSINIVGVQQIKTTLTIGDEVGFVLDTDALHFGTIRRQGTSTRAITITPTNNPLIIKVQGNISEYIYILNNEASTTGRIEFVAHSKEPNYGYYEGFVTIYQVKSTNLLELILPGKKIITNYVNHTPSVNLTLV